MALKHITTVWLIRQGLCLAWAMARAAGRLGSFGERLEARLDAVAVARHIDVLAPLSVA